MPHAKRHSRLRVRLGPVTEPAVARHAIRLARHRWVVGVEVGRRLATGRCTHDHRAEEIRPIRALSGLPKCGPLIVRSRAIEGDQLGTTLPVRRKADPIADVKRVVAGHEETREPTAVVSRRIRYVEVVAPRLRETRVRHDPVARRIDAILPGVQVTRFEIVREDCVNRCLRHVSEGNLIRGEASIRCRTTDEDRGDRQHDIMHQREPDREFVFERHRL